MDLRVHLPELAPAAAAAHERLAAMPAPRRDELARVAQERASELGLMRGLQPIPLVLSPVALPREELSALGRAARLVVSALVKVCRELIEGSPDRASSSSSISPRWSRKRCAPAGARPRSCSSAASTGSWTEPGARVRSR